MQKILTRGPKASGPTPGHSLYRSAPPAAPSPIRADPASPPRRETASAPRPQHASCRTLLAGAWAQGEKRRLALSVPVGFDTLYGAAWSPDGKLVSFGCPDNALRAIDAATGAQVLQQSSHSDWVLGTVFTQKGDQLVSVGRDMSAKLTEVATQRFIDN
ncbi:MAG: hypothetical protein K8R23_03130, partial [Chthoniobacter sp.]|nr:hypothetical protein [Chthoniobacter sp.]